MYQPLAGEVIRLNANVEALISGAKVIGELSDMETSMLDWAAHVMEERTEVGRS